MTPQSPAISDTGPTFTSSRRWRNSAAALWIAKNSRSGIVRGAARVASAFLDAFENSSHDMEKNGEVLILRSLRRGSIRTVFDVGANVGDWSTSAVDCFPESVVHCFELDPDTRTVLRTRLSERPNFTISDTGLYSAEQDVEYKYFPDDPSLTSSLDFPHPRRSELRTAAVTTGDAYLQSAGIRTVDLLKIDVEGSEGEVLRGFAEALSEGRIGMIQFEYGWANALSGFLLRDAYELLLPRGYLVGKIYPDGVGFVDYHVSLETFRGSNWFAVRASDADTIRRLRR